MTKFLLSLFLVFTSNLYADKEELIGGVPDNGFYQEVVYIETVLAEGSARCSATVVGPKVLLTAGHCTQVDGTVSFNGYSAQCTQSPLYPKVDHDVALCVIDREVDVKPASIAKTGPKIGESVTLSGYGCTQPGGGEGNDGILRVGSAKVYSLPQDANYYFNAYGRSAICFGDSGGPSFKKGTHQVLGVNSRGNIKDVSYLTALWTETSMKFFSDFAKDNQVEVCGVNLDC